MEEPSILDYLKSKLPWSRRHIEIPAIDQDELPPEVREEKPAVYLGPYPWRSLLALGLGLFAQLQLEPSPVSKSLALVFYGLAFGMLLWAFYIHEWTLAPLRPSEFAYDPLSYRLIYLIVSLPLALAAFLAFGGNLFTPLNLTLWLLALALYIHGIWLVRPGEPTVLTRFKRFLSQDHWQVNITRWSILLLAVLAIALFYRFYNLSGTPAEPFSDHAEKLLDVYDVSVGQTHIFFPRNTGREAIQMYLTFFVSWLFGTGLSFMSLKIGTVLAGVFTLPYVYLFGKEVGGRRVALFALFLTGIAYWPNVISRVGLRFPLYPVFAAPTLYYLVRGLRTQNRNDFILSGLFLGIGLHGYTAFRFMPLVVTAAIGIYLLHARKEMRTQTVLMFIIVALTSLLVFLPLLRYATENPGAFMFRIMTRMTGTETQLSGPPWQVFLHNLWNAMFTMNVNNGDIWVHSVPNRPALDIVSATLFAFGFVLVLVRYARERHWLDLFLMVSIPLLMMPSILSLAFPNENPSLNRTGGAYIPVFIIVGLALDGLYKSLRGVGKARSSRVLASFVLGILFLWAGAQNYSLIFNQYSQEFRLASWNTSDMGRVIKAFVAEGNPMENAWVVPYPYWVDTRLVGIQAGYPKRDAALERDALPSTLDISGSKLFLVKEEDTETLDALRQLYPLGALNLFQASVPGHNFWIFFVANNQFATPSS